MTLCTNDLKINRWIYLQNLSFIKLNLAFHLLFSFIYAFLNFANVSPSHSKIDPNFINFTHFLDFLVFIFPRIDNIGEPLLMLRSNFGFREPLS